MGTVLRHLLASEVEGARVHAGVSFSRLAQATGIRGEALADLLDGREDFTIVDLVRIAEVLDVPVTTLLPGAVGEDG
ncbi:MULTISPECIES: helix-turn-helix domain-containing protein [unclassified Microbacterium]|uniref:helix-turn-helix domain-containing protein n=1 Tax=unclassified Microbacterium TaxID=2609290 RepID=UPI003019E887